MMERTIAYSSRTATGIMLHKAASLLLVVFLLSTSAPFAFAEENTESTSQNQQSASEDGVRQSEQNVIDGGKQSEVPAEEQKTDTAEINKETDEKMRIRNQYNNLHLNLGR